MITMNLVTVATAPSRMIAEMWVNLLRNEGIPAMVEAKDVASLYGGGGMAPCRVMTPEERAEDALRVLEGSPPEDVVEGLEEEMGR
jgi:hypothetical protein